MTVRIRHHATVRSPTRSHVLWAALALTLATEGCLVVEDDDFRGGYSYCDQSGCYSCDDYGCFPESTSPSAVPEGSSCTRNADCIEGCYCSARGVCEEAGFCTTDAGCEDGFICDDRDSCVPGRRDPDPDPSGCTSDNKCPPGFF